MGRNALFWCLNDLKMDLRHFYTYLVKSLISFYIGALRHIIVLHFLAFFPLLPRN